IAAANEAGGRDNITVVLLRLEEVGAGAAPPAPGSSDAGTTDARGAVLEHEAHDDLDSTVVGAPAVTPAVTPRRPRRPSPNGKATVAPRRRLRRVGALAVVLVVL